MRSSAPAVCLLACLAALAPRDALAEAPRTVFVIGHAEKSSGNDPSLTARGRERAEALAHTLRSAKIAAIFVTERKRTRETAAPLARALGLAPQVVQGDVTPLLRALPPGRRVLVVSHSDVVPEIGARLACPPIEALSDGDYDRPYVLALADEGTCELTYLHYGARSSHAD